MDKKKQGKKNRASGTDFERRVRVDLESKGWIVSKWMNNVELIKSSCPYCDELQGVEGEIHRKNCNMGNWDIGKLIPAKHKFRGPGRPMAIGTGFPDFVCFKRKNRNYEIIGVECKSNGYLDKIEKEKCSWLLENNIFSKILIAYKEKEGRKIVVKYKEFKNVPK